VVAFGPPPASPAVKTRQKRNERTIDPVVSGSGGSAKRSILSINERRTQTIAVHLSENTMRLDAARQLSIINNARSIDCNRARARARVCFCRSSNDAVKLADSISFSLLVFTAIIKLDRKYCAGRSRGPAKGCENKRRVKF